MSKDRCLTLCGGAVYGRGWETYPMASNTKATEYRRKNKSNKTGRDRKKALAKNGTTRTEAELFGNELSAAPKR